MGVQAHACRIFVCFLFLSILLAAPAWSGEKKDQPQRKEALVLLTFGSTYDQPKDPLEPVLSILKKQRPQLPVFTAYTANRVVSHMREQGKEVRTPAQVLADLSSQGYTHVVMQSLHVTPGKEYAMASDIATRFNALPKGITQVDMGLPLIGSHQDAEALAETLVASLPAARKKGEAVIYVGHGAEDPVGSLAYPALAYFLRQIDPHLFVGTIEGPFDLESILKQVKASKAKTVWLTPLLTVVGDHASNDIFGDEDDSWKQTFAKAGLTVKTIPQGLAFVPGVAEIWARHADAAIRDMESE